MNSIRHVTLTLVAFCALASSAGPPVSNPLAGHYLGSVFVSTTGSSVNPETDIASIDIEVFSDGHFNGNSTVLTVGGTVAVSGDVSFAPNQSGFTLGKIAGGVFSATSDQPNGDLIVHWRISAKTASGSSNLRILQQPVGSTISSGGSVSLSVEVDGSPATYQWYQGNSGDTSTPVGVNSRIFNTPSLTQTTSYWVRVSDAVLVLDSQTAVITVMPLDTGTPPEITAQPRGTTLPTGESASLSVQAQGKNLTYQWYLGVTGDTSHPIPQANSTAYVTPPLEVTVNNFWVRITSGTKSVDSDTAAVLMLRKTPLAAQWQVVGKTRFFVTPPSINDAGEVAYARLESGMALGTPGTPVLRDLQAFITSIGQVVGLDALPVITGDDAKVAFALEKALVLHFPGKTNILVQNGAQAPGLPAGTLLEFPSINPPFAMNPSGVFAFATALSGAGVRTGNNGNDQGVFRGPPEDLNWIVRGNDPAPGLPAGYLFGSKGDEPFAVAINRAGTSLIRARAIESRTRQFAQGLWLHTPAQGLSIAVKAIQQGALRGDTAPGTGGAVFREFFSPPAINDEGTIGLVASTFDFNTFASGIGIWVGPPNDLQPVMIGKAAIPAMAGYQFDQPLLDPSLKLGTDRFIAFRATILGLNVTSANNIGLFVGTSLSNIRLLARTGTRPPGTAEGITFADIQGSSIVVFGHNRVAFTAVLSGPALGANNSGVWATDAAGNLQLLALSGDLLPTNEGNIGIGGGIFLQHGSGSDGRPSGGNRLGQLTLLDGSIDSHAFRITLEETTTAPRLSFQSGPQLLTLSWPDGYSLQSSPVVNAQTWTEIATASPKSFPTDQHHAFYRLIKR